MTAFRPATPEYSWKELMFEAASRAYADAGVDPRTDVDSFITCAEDYYEGFGIFDEFVPDQLGAALRPTCTVSGDGLQGLANAFMQIETGLVDVAVVEAHSKASDIVTLEGVIEHALDPVWNKPLGAHPFVIAGLEADAYLRATKTPRRALAAVVRKNRRPSVEIDLAEVDDRFSFKELLHLEALGLAKKGEAGKRALRGDYGADGSLPVNVSGGSLGCGNVFEATGLHRAAEVALQLRGDAGMHQVDGVQVGVAQSWRFVPSATGAVAVLGGGRCGRSASSGRACGPSVAASKKPAKRCASLPRRCRATPPG